MTFFEWTMAHRLTGAEVAEIVGVAAQSITNAKARGSYSPTWDSVARLAENAPLEPVFSEEGSHRQPVVKFGDDPRAYGPADVIRGDGRIAAHVVLLWASQWDRSEEDYQTARRFLRYWPDGPQLR